MTADAAVPMTKWFDRMEVGGAVTGCWHRRWVYRAGEAECAACHILVIVHPAPPVAR